VGHQSIFRLLLDCRHCMISAQEIVGFRATVNMGMPCFRTFFFIVLTERTPKPAMISFHPTRIFPPFPMSILSTASDQVTSLGAKTMTNITYRSPSHRRIPAVYPQGRTGFLPKMGIIFSAPIASLKAHFFPTLSLSY